MHVCRQERHLSHCLTGHSLIETFIFVVDGEIYIARGDGKGSDGINAYEMVHLRPLPNTDPSQPTSYIMEPVQYAVSGSATSYVLHQTSQEQGANKLVKISSCSSPARQVIETHDEGNTQVSRFNILKSVY